MADVAIKEAIDGSFDSGESCNDLQEVEVSDELAKGASKGCLLRVYGSKTDATCDRVAVRRALKESYLRSRAGEGRLPL